MVIHVEGLVRGYGRKTVLRDVSFAVDAGEVVALAGINGAGKTTAVNVLMGFIERERGSARVLGSDPAERRHLGEVGWMPEQPAFPNLRLRKLLRFQARTFPRWDAELARKLALRLELDQEAPPAPSSSDASRRCLPRF